MPAISRGNEGVNSNRVLGSETDTKSAQYDHRVTYLTIDSRGRQLNSSSAPAPLDPSSAISILTDANDFTVELNEPIKNVVKCELIAATIPATMGGITDRINTLYFDFGLTDQFVNPFYSAGAITTNVIGAPDPTHNDIKSVCIPKGVYTGEQLANELQYQVNFKLTDNPWQFAFDASFEQTTDVSFVTSGDRRGGTFGKVLNYGAGYSGGGSTSGLAVIVASTADSALSTVIYTEAYKIGVAYVTIELGVITKISLIIRNDQTKWYSVLPGRFGAGGGESTDFDVSDQVYIIDPTPGSNNASAYVVCNGYNFLQVEWAPARQQFIFRPQSVAFDVVSIPLVAALLNPNYNNPTPGAGVKVAITAYQFQFRMYNYSYDTPYKDINDLAEVIGFVRKGSFECRADAIIAAGTGYVATVLTATVPTIGGTGTGMTMRIHRVSAGAVVTVTVAATGLGYTDGDIVTINSGNVDCTVQIKLSNSRVYNQTDIDDGSGNRGDDTSETVNDPRYGQTLASAIFADYRGIKYILMDLDILNGNDTFANSTVSPFFQLDNKPYFARVWLSDVGQSTRSIDIASTSYPAKVAYYPPLRKVKNFRVRLRQPDGTLYNFEQLDWTITLALSYATDQLPRGAIFD